ncbi:MAG TPA: outer membrane lipoprotein-sorting protein [Bacteroidales bacterium]|jgi:outer membrane lipoprotein-sorting protein|nr:outer membrane lipoprotein-sorting protein [Bacteroidales bacterium]HOX73346.1 outer membrane lipoprotein-sorting protein [Bacteroidales bacterium]HPM86556.1 outer membrane lipoprotein-sorting protein [Bacteroidales bacterium]HQM67832.1 outer membrane lipoprotein-sorting protein [Bacteroidales bacterium]
MKQYFIYLILATGVSFNHLSAQDLSATEIVKKADEKFNGEKSSYSLMSMTIIRPGWQRTIDFKSWTFGRDFALTLITAPAKEAGQSFLKRGPEMWNWNPSINRLIKLPPSMMSQGWMGSDYTNDDILKESSVVNDYLHEMAGEENIDGRICYKINMTAKENASIVWGKQIRWIDKKEFLVLKAELYDEDGYLVRTETGSDIKVMDGRTVTSKIKLIPEEEPQNLTYIEIREIKFNIPVEESYFSQQNMKRVR